MVKIEECLKYLYEKQADAIHHLKTENLSFFEHTKFAYVAPDGKTFRNHRPDQSLIDSGWKYAKVTYKRFSSVMNRKHPKWSEYINAKRAATILLASKLLLKATKGVVPKKSEISAILSYGFMRHHARTMHEQKILAYRAYKRLKKLNNQLINGRVNIDELNSWLAERDHAFENSKPEDNRKDKVVTICLTLT